MNLHDGAISLSSPMEGVLKAAFSLRIFCLRSVALKKQNNVSHIALIRAEEN